MPERLVRIPEAEYLALGVAGMISACFALLLLSDKHVAALVTSERGLIENVGAVAFVSAAVLFAAAWARSHRRFHIVLAAAFLVAAGEELSWGQHLIGFDVPETVATHNAQEEVNVHNLGPFQNARHAIGMDVFLIAFVAAATVYIGVLPLLARSSPRLGHQLETAVPVVPVVFAGLLLFHLLVYVAFWVIMPKERAHAVTEVAEAGFGLIIAALALDAARERLGGRRIPSVADAKGPGLPVRSVR